MKRKTVAEMTQEGYSKYPRYVYSNSLSYDEDCHKHPNPAQFWHKEPIKYELVYRDDQYIYVPVGDKRSSEANGGLWSHAFEGLNLESYAYNFTFVFSDLQMAKTVQDILVNVVKNYEPREFSQYEDVSFIRAAMDCFKGSGLDPLKYLPDYQKVLKDWCFSRCSINSKLKPHYRLDENDQLVPYNSRVANSNKIGRYLKAIEGLKEKIAKYEGKIKELS